MTLTLSFNELILLILVQAVITANLVLGGFWMHDVHVQRKADRKWADEVNARAYAETHGEIGWDHATTDEICDHLDSWLDDSHVVTYNDDLPY